MSNLISSIGIEFIKLRSASSARPRLAEKPLYISMFLLMASRTRWAPVLSFIYSRSSILNWFFFARSKSFSILYISLYFSSFSYLNISSWNFKNSSCSCLYLFKSILRFASISFAFFWKKLFDYNSLVKNLINATVLLLWLSKMVAINSLTSSGKSCTSD